MKRVLEEKEGDGPAKRAKRDAFLEALASAEAKTWGDDDEVDLERCKQLKYAGIKMRALHSHMKQFPTDFPPKYLPILRDWVRDIRLIEHYVEDDEQDRASCMSSSVRLRNGREFAVEGSRGCSIVTLTLKADGVTILSFYDELEYGDEAQWDELVRGELPADDVDCPGSSFMLRFFCFLGFGDLLDDGSLDSLELKEYGSFASIESAVGIEYGVSDSSQVYQRYPFFREYWRYLEHQVVAVLGGPTKPHPLPPVLTRVVLDYALCPPNIDQPSDKKKKRKKKNRGNAA